MPRYFIEVAYNGGSFSGFQIQENAHTIQSEIEKAFLILFRIPVQLTGSSRTDAGVHARQNYFHFDWHETFIQRKLYNLNALLPEAIVIKRIVEVPGDAHCRFHATAREYRYYITTFKDPFLVDRSWYFPYQLNTGTLNKMAAFIKEQNEFKVFSKRNSQVKTYNCIIYESRWEHTTHMHIYHVKANRFLRGMVRGLVGTMLKVARGGMTFEDFCSLFDNQELSGADFSAPAKGLFLEKVDFPSEILIGE